MNAVVVQAKRLNASRGNRTGWYTMGEVCEILGMDHNWVRRRIENGSLQATRQNGGRRRITRRITREEHGASRRKIYGNSYDAIPTNSMAGTWTWCSWSTS